MGFPFCYANRALLPTGNLRICVEDDYSHLLLYEDAQVLCLQCHSRSADCQCDICCNWYPRHLLQLVPRTSSVMAQGEPFLSMTVSIPI